MPELSAFGAQLQGSGRARDLHDDGVRAHPQHAAARQADRPARRPDRARRVAHVRHGGHVPPVRDLQPARASSTSPRTPTSSCSTRRTRRARSSRRASTSRARSPRWIAAATSYSNHGVPMIPFYIYYSMFGFQRVGDLAWAAGDSRARGFLLGGTAGRTTLNGEGLQHEDGHSHVLASTIPNCVSYDPTYALRGRGDRPGRPAADARRAGGRLLLPHADERELPAPGDAGGRRGGDPARDVPAAREPGRAGGQAARAAARLGHDPARGARGAPSCSRTTSASPPTSGASRASPSCAATASRPSAGTCCTRRRRRGGPTWRRSSTGAAARSSPRPTTCARSPSRSGRTCPAPTACSAPTASAAATTASSCAASSRSTATTSTVAALKALADEGERRAGRGAEGDRELRHRSRPARAAPGLRRGAMSTATAASDVLVPDIGDFADVPIIEILVAPGDTRRGGGPARHARVRQGDDGRPVADGGRGAGAEGRASATRSPRARCCSRSSRPTRPRRSRRPRRWPSRPSEEPAAAERAAEARRRRAAAAGRRPPSRPRPDGAAPPTRARARGASRASSASTSRRSRAPGARAASPATTSRAFKEGGAQPAARRRPPRRPGTAGSTCCRGRRSTSRSSARSSVVPLSRIKKISGANLARNWVRDPARHPQRRGRHHRPRGVPQADERGRQEAGGEGDDGRLPDQGVRRRAEGVPGVQRLARRRRPDRQALLQHRLRGRHAERARRAGDQGRRRQGPPRDRRRAGRALRQGARGQAQAGRHGGRHLHDLQPRRHRRHELHADRQRARGRDPRRRALGDEAGLERRGVRAAADAAAVALLRPPRDRRRGRRALRDVPGRPRSSDMRRVLL